MAKKKDPAKELEVEVIDLVTEQKQLETKETELMNDYPQFAEFLQAQKSFQEKSDILWGTIQASMEKHDIKSIKGAWGYITLVDKMSFEIDLKKLPPKFIKKVPDTKKIGDTYKLTGTLVKGTTPKYTKYLKKGIK